MRTNVLLAAAGLGFAVSFLAPQTVHAEEISAEEVAVSDAVTENTCDAQEVEAQPEEAAPVLTEEENVPEDAVITESVEDTKAIAAEVSDTDESADTTVVTEGAAASEEAPSSVNEIVDTLPVPEDIVTVPAEEVVADTQDNTQETVEVSSSEDVSAASVIEAPVQDDDVDEYYVPALRPEAPSFEDENPEMTHLASYMTADGSLLSVEGEEPAMVLIYSNEEISVNGIPASMCGDAGETENGEYYALVPVSGNVLVNSTNFRAQIVSGNRGKGSNIVSVYTEDGVLPAPVTPDEPVPEEPKHEEPKAEEPETPVVDVPEEPKHEEPKTEEPKAEEPETPVVVVPEEPKHEEPKAEEPKTPEVTVPETPDVVTVESSETEETPVSEEVFPMTDDDMETEVIAADTDDQVVVEPVIHTDRVLPQTGDESYNMQLLLVLFMISGAAILVWKRNEIK